MMKQIAYFASMIIILMALAGCAEINFLNEPGTDIDDVSEVTETAEITPKAEIPDTAATSETTPPTVKPDATTTPEITPSPSPDVFNIDDVEMQPTPGSSCFSEIGYDPDWEILVVRFRDSGAVYTYSNFPMEEWDKFTSASSLGSWYNKHIKGKYEYERLS